MQLLQAAEALARAAMAHGRDPAYDSPYAAEAVAHGKDMPKWAKLKEGRWQRGKFKLAKLAVSPVQEWDKACVTCCPAGYVRSGVLSVLAARRAASWTTWLWSWPCIRQTAGLPALRRHLSPKQPE